VRGRVWHFATCWFLRRRFMAPSPPVKVRGPPLVVAVHDYLFCIHLTYLKAFFYIPNLKTRHSEMTGTHLPRITEFSNW
jgi:hypothetical protein